MIQTKFVLFMCVVIIRSGNETNEIINRLIKSFLSNYQEEEKILQFCIWKCWFIDLSYS